MAECIVCKGEYTPGSKCPRCGANNGPWERWQAEHPEEQGGLQGMVAFARPHLFFPFILTVFACGCSLIGMGGLWTGIQPGFQLITVILTVAGCLLAFQATYEARHQIREQMLLTPLLRGRHALLKNPRTRALLVPALTVLFAFLLIVGIVSSSMLRELLCWLVFEPNYCKEEPGGFRERLTEALPLILMVCTGGFMVSFSRSSSILIAMRYANTMRNELPLPIFLDDDRLSQIVRRAAEKILDRPDGLAVHVSGLRKAEKRTASWSKGLTNLRQKSETSAILLPNESATRLLQSRELEKELSGHWNWSDMERTPDGGIRMKAYGEEGVRKEMTEVGLSKDRRIIAVYTVTADPWGRIRRIQREEKRE